jgi:endonuclease/exonuclease/phosphatase (EEP) superfamily protein YafD
MWYRRRWLAVANLLIIACHLYLIAPDFLRDRRFAAGLNSAADNAQPAKKLRIFFANVRLENRAKGAMLREIRDADPDIVVFVEFAFWWRNAVLRSPTMSAYTYGSGLSPDQAAGNSVNIFSKLPITSDTREWIAGRCVETVEIPIGSQTLRLVGIHAPRPMEFRDNDYNGFWSRVLPMLIEKHGPTIVIGDFNATQYSQVYQQLTAGGLRSAHDDQGRGYATTWPNGYYWVPPIRIDQALLSPEVACMGISEGQGTGSDHKPLVLDVEIPQQP